MKENKMNGLGFVDLVDQMGNSLSIVNAARVSFGKRHTGELRQQDRKLIKYLVESQAHVSIQTCDIHISYQSTDLRPETMAKAPGWLQLE